MRNNLVNVDSIGIRSLTRMLSIEDRSAEGSRCDGMTTCTESGRRHAGSARSKTDGRDVLMMVHVGPLLSKESEEEINEHQASEQDGGASVAEVGDQQLGGEHEGQRGEGLAGEDPSIVGRHVKGTKGLVCIGGQQRKDATDAEINDTDPNEIDPLIDGDHKGQGGEEDGGNKADDRHDDLVSEFVIEGAPNRSRETIAQGRDGADKGKELIVFDFVQDQCLVTFVHSVRKHTL